MGAERDRGRMDIMFGGGGRKMLCWATKQKVSDSLFPIQNRGVGHSQEDHVMVPGVSDNLILILAGVGCMGQ